MTEITEQRTIVVEVGLSTFRQKFCDNRHSRLVDLVGTEGSVDFFTAVDAVMDGSFDWSARHGTKMLC